MLKVNKKLKRNINIQVHPSPMVSDDLDKYLAHPVILKKLEKAKTVLDNFDFSKK